MENTDQATAEKAGLTETQKRRCIVIAIVGSVAVVGVFVMMNVASKIYQADATTQEVDWNRQLELQSSGAAPEIDPAKLNRIMQGGGVPVVPAAPSAPAQPH